MSELLETMMLICFGLSWPISVWKNFKSRTATGMSQPFILLIITGYVAGILSKIITGRINYVLIVYAFNLIMVLADLIIYYRNKRIDNKQKQLQLALSK